jgi:hypothetical protein
MICNLHNTKPSVLPLPLSPSICPFIPAFRRQASCLKIPGHQSFRATENITKREKIQYQQGFHPSSLRKEGLSFPPTEGTILLSLYGRKEAEGKARKEEIQTAQEIEPANDNILRQNNDGQGGYRRPRETRALLSLGGVTLYREYNENHP